MLFRPSHTYLGIKLTLSVDHVAASIQGFIWPKIFWDFLTHDLDRAVYPVPALQIVNLILALLIIAWEWPLSIVAGTEMHRSIKARFWILGSTSLATTFIYQATNPAIYYSIGLGVYLWAYVKEEVSEAPLAIIQRLTFHRK